MNASCLAKHQCRTLAGKREKRRSTRLSCADGCSQDALFDFSISTRCTLRCSLEKRHWNRDLLTDTIVSFAQAFRTVVWQSIVEFCLALVLNAGFAHLRCALQRSNLNPPFNTVCQLVPNLFWPFAKGTLVVIRNRW
jgi:C4-dicarboxylate-specific signal transduction histidine kinase